MTRILIAVAVVVVVGWLAMLWAGGAIARRIIRAVFVLGGLGVLYVGFTFAQVWWTSTRDDRPPSVAIVVLGAAQYNGVPSPVLKARLDHAAALYRAGVAPTIIVTGSKQEGDRVGEGFTGYDYLKGDGIPESAIKIESTGMDTYQELSASRHILDVSGLEGNVVLVSSPYHGQRSLAIAGEVGLDATFSAAGDESTTAALARETAAVAAGRIIGFRRLSNLQ